LPQSRTVSNRLGLDANDLGLLGVVVIWGVNLTVVKWALREMLPLAFNGVRFVLASVTLLALVKVYGESYGTGRRDTLRLVAAGLLGHTAYQIFFIEGIARTTASHAALIFGITPVVVALLSQLLGHERVTGAGWTGAALAFAGVYIIIAGKAPPAGPAPSLTGDLLVLVAALCWCVYTVMARPLLTRYSPLKVTAISMAWGVAAMIPFCGPSVARQDWSAVTPGGWAATVYSFLFALVVAYLLWYRSVHKVGNVRTAVYSNLVPVTGTFAGWLFLGETLYPALGVGATAIFLGIALTRSGRAAGKRQEPASGRTQESRGVSELGEEF
jgi:drug/metabolite transporter (DMT)-like permease